jgi:hypothetical protein
MNSKEFTTQAECAPRADRSADSNYIAGMKAGYNFGVVEDNAGMQKCIEQRLKDIRESGREVQAECAPREAQPDATGMRTLVHQIVALEPLKHPDNMENAVRILSRVIAAAGVSERADAEKDAARWRWLKMQSTVGEQTQIMRTPWGQWDAYADAAILAETKGK